MHMSITFSQEEFELRKITIGKLISKPALILPFLIEELERVCLFGNNLYVYNGVHYELMDPNIVSRVIFNFFLKYGVEEKYNQAKDREFRHLMSVSPQIPRVEKFDDYQNLICVKNGILDVSTFVLHPHSPDFYFTYFVDVDYVPTAVSAPTFERFLEGLFASSGSWGEGYHYNADMVENMLRLGGYILHPETSMKMLFLFLGSGSNGKSIMLDIFCSLFPRKFTTSLSLSTLASENSPERIQLTTSRLNVCSEARGEAVDAEEIKKIVSSEKINIKRKFMDPVDIYPKTKIIIASNSMPYFTDTSYGINRRLTIFSFKNRFIPAGEFSSPHIIFNQARIFPQVPYEELWSGIMSEKTAILNKFLDALIRLRRDNWHMIQCSQMNEAIEEYKEGADTLGNWLANNYKYDTAAITSLNTIFEEFRQYYYDNFGDKKFNYSTASLSRKVRELYRVESLRIREMGAGGVIRSTGFNLIKYDKQSEKDSDEILIRIEQGGRDGNEAKRPISGDGTPPQASLFSEANQEVLNPDLSPKSEDIESEGGDSKEPVDAI